MSGLTPLNAEGRLASAIRQARLAQADHLNAVLDIRDAKQLRLSTLQADLTEITTGSEAAASLFDLVLTQGEPPRLWIDGTTYVVMEPDPRSYRFIREGQDTREILLETRKRADMVEHIIQYMAHRIVERERNLVARPERTATVAGYSGLTLIATWFGGFVLGVVLLLAAGLGLGFLRL
ncbi:hypothetical protein [Rhodoligotrophos defluvii]|uniref:hypothetical protein n=1 Tax=Rhodoligotrophos defluvii TaxID=2561934 RepID=UPI0010C9C56F|nr:hypothetical protein [Rhodoligotrophos defluvii]